MKKILTLLIISILVFSICGSAIAANTRKGKKTYNKVCRSCHVSGAHGGRVAPSNKTMTQWQEFIEQNQHQADLEIINGISQKDRDNLLKFLKDFAKDAKAVQTCG
jgi:cytochrome c553